MKKRILSIVLSVCMVLMLVPQTVFAEGAGGAYNLVKGTNGAGDNEGPGSLIDGNDGTKWCVTGFEEASIIFMTSSDVNISGYSITTGNDNTENPGRNPKNWALYGCNNYTGNSTDNWVEIHRVSNDTVLQDENNTTYHFVFDKTETAYQYYKLEITAIQAGDVMQMSEFALTDCAHVWDTSSVVKKDPTSCTDQGYIKTTCTKCKRVKIDVIAPFAHDFSAENGKCKYCSKTKKELFTINVSNYATKAQLMDDTFAPDPNGNATNIGKLVFGKNSSGNPQKWYILGKDEGVSGDNTIIFATSPIATGQVFEVDTGVNKPFKSSYGVYKSAPSEVSSNHYGASDLRVALQNMAVYSTYFTKAEKDMMNFTTVTTKDTKNGSVTYTTTDKLYALAADGWGYSYTTIKAGTSNSVVLAVNKYWNSGDKFWLRSPGNTQSSALYTNTSGYVFTTGVNVTYAIQPASNLNLSSVLFASAATAASSDTVSGTITPGTAMTLRLDGTGKKIGTVTYNTTTGDIKVTKGSTSQTVALVVQGNDGTSDWYYSKKVTGTETVNVSAIVSESNTPASIDLSTCKIWLETTNGMIYAVKAFEEIPTVEITGIDAPSLNVKLDTEALCATTGVSSTTPQITWTPNDSTAGYNTSYTASVTLAADTGYEFADTVTATVNGKTATGVNKNADGTLTVTYNFPSTDRDKLKSITAPQAKTVANGTASDAIIQQLPSTVAITTEGNTVTSASVTWNTDPLLSKGSYDPDKLTEQIVTLSGTVTCPATIDANSVDLTTTITITISAADIVVAPTANPVAGTYTSDQSVVLNSATEGAEIYYTTDGSIPSRTNGTQYTEPINVTGTELQSVETTIKAIAVKNKMQDSSVETFTYTIQIPDTTLPAGEIKANENSWNVFRDNIAFNIFFKDALTVDITANDNSGEAVIIEYLLSDKELTIDELDAATFTAYTGKFSIEPNNKCVIYAKLTDTSNNVAYINSDGIVLDKEAPVISGIENGKTYCTAQTVAVSDKYDVIVTVNNKPVSLTDGKFTLLPANGTQTIVVTDKAGNVSAEMIVTINDGHTDKNNDHICDFCGEDKVGVNAWDETVLRLQATASKTSIKLKWNAVPEADGYVIYWSKCGSTKPFKQVKVGKTLTWTHKNLKKGSWNRYFVKAYKVIDGKKTFIKASNKIHLTTKGGKYTNVKKLKASTSSVTLKKGKTKALKIKQVYAEKNKKPTLHMRPLTYTSSDKNVATVTSKGVIKAKGTGSCYIYITAYSGVYTRVKVTIK